MDPPLALLHQFISHFRQVKNHQFNLLYPVLKQALVRITAVQIIITDENRGRALTS
jgi:hypothetical protein